MLFDEFIRLKTFAQLNPFHKIALWADGVLLDEFGRT